MGVSSINKDNIKCSLGTYLLLRLFIISLLPPVNAMNSSMKTCHEVQPLTWRRYESTHEDKLHFRIHDCTSFSTTFSSSIAPSSADLYNETVTVLLDNMPPYVVINGEGTGSEPSGYLGDAWRALERRLCFRSLLRRVAFRRGQTLLLSSAGHVHLRPTAITSADAHLMPFSFAVASSWYELYVRAPQPAAGGRLYVDAWSGPLWVATTVTVVLLALGVWTALRLTPNGKPVNPSLISCIMVVLRCNIYEDAAAGNASHSTRGAGLRLTVLSALVFALLTTAAYCSALTARLAVHDAHLPFATLNDVPRSAHALCVRRGSFAYLQFQEREGGAPLAKWESALERYPCRGVRRTSQLARALCSGHRVAALEAPALLAAVAPACPLARVRGRFAPTHLALQMSRRFTHARLLSAWFLRLREVGVLQRLQVQWLKCHPELIDTNTPPSIDSLRVPLRRIASAMRAVAVATAVAFALLAAECLHVRFH